MDLKKVLRIGISFLNGFISGLQCDRKNDGMYALNNT